jgi:tetratricopeptide (TPR) repeat protein
VRVPSTPHRESGARRRRPDWRAIACALAIAAAAVAVYAPVRDNTFVNFDDASYVADNAMVQRGFSADGVRWAFTTGHAGNWHPVTWLSHMADAEWFGPGPRAPHVTNVVLHVLSALLLFRLLVSLTGALWRSTVVALLFAVHPLHVESVAWVAERKDVLSAVFWMLTLLAYVSYARRGGVGRYLIVVAAFAIGLMAKPMLVTLPVVLLLIDGWPLRRTAHTPVSRLLAEKVPLLAMSAASSVVTFLVQRESGAVRSLDALPFVARAGNAALAYVIYIAKTIWPVHLAAIYPYPSGPRIPWLASAAALILVVVTMAAIRLRRRAPYVTTGWLWYLVTLTPVIGLIQVGSQPWADRYTYLPSIGLFVAVVWASGEIVKDRRATLAAGAIAIAAIAALAVTARAQVLVWRDSVTLWTHAAAVTRDNARAHTNLGHALALSGRLDAALAEYETALRVRPDLAEAHNYLGLALFDRRDATGAISHYREAVRLRPAFTLAHNNLCMALGATGDLDGAIAACTEAVRLDPRFAAAHGNLGVALARAGRLDDALREFRVVLDLQPESATAHLNLAAALVDADRPAEALAHFVDALRIDPANARAHHDYGQALSALGRDDDAIVQLAEASRLSPASAAFHLDFAVALAGRGRREAAVVELERALQIDPGNIDARRLMAALKNR